jgi:TRAP transporter TAXI family solute receptor
MRKSATLIKKSASILIAGIASLCFLVISFAMPGQASARNTYVTIGTGGVTGVYYPTGGAISKIVNKKSKKYKLKVTVESTGGSVFNTNAIMAGDLEFGIVESSRQNQAWNGTMEWAKKGPQKNLRSICSFHPESVTIVAGDDTGIKTFRDLKGKHVNIGNPGSGQRGEAIELFDQAGINWKKDIKAEGMKAVESAQMLQDGRIDAFFYTVGHPNGSIKEATAGNRKVHFVPIPDDIIMPLIKKHPYFAKAFIPTKFYPFASNKKDVPTLAVKATFCTSINVPENVVYAITKEIFDNLDAFKKLHPAFTVLTKQNMLTGLTAPIHPGALKYYKEAGLIKYINKSLIK